jgi:hypothetical protein
MRDLRSIFSETEMVVVKDFLNHSHGASAAMRTTASDFMETVTSTAGMVPVFYQGSAADAKRDRVLTREWRWVKDMNVSPSIVRKEKEHLVIMVDVDYYVDMPEFLGEHFRPILMYTFQPSQAAKATGEYKYSFNEKDEVCYFVSGGGSYRHKVWNYDGDSLTAVRSVWGVPVTFSTYSLERRMTDEDHQVVLLAPIRKFRGLFAWIAMWRLGQKPLKRHVFSKDGYVRLLVDSNKEMLVSTAKTNSFLACTIPVTQDDAIGARARTIKRGLELSSVKAVVGNDKPGVEVLHEYWLSNVGYRSTMIRLLDGVRRYQYVNQLTDLDQDAKDGMVAFMHPIIDGAFVPDQSVNNDAVGIKRRVEMPQRGVNNVSMSRFVSKCIEEWISIKMAHLNGELLFPVEMSVVYDKQHRPTQRVILEKADYEHDKHTLSTFGKREAYGKVNYQRNITTLPGNEKKWYSTYMYAYTNFLKQMHWYAFGSTPKCIADRVAKWCEGASHMLLTDYSFFDGSINNILRAKQRRELMALFHPSSRALLSSLLCKQVDRQARSRFGVTYNTGKSRLSGSPETSVQNTDDNAFSAYVALRSSGRTPDQAWEMLGLFGGDDGIIPDLNPKVMERTAVCLGLDLKCVVVKRGLPGVTFLSRHYGPDVWFGASDSICDVKRILSKFHVTVAMPSNVTPQVKLFEKAFALSLSDSNTPIIGPFVSRVIELYCGMKYMNKLGIWNGDYDKEVHYPNENGASWMYEYVQEMLPDFDVARFEQWAGQATEETILHPPKCCDAPAPNPKCGTVVVDGDVVVVEEPPAPKAKRPRARKPKRDRPNRSQENGGSPVRGRHRLKKKVGVKHN